mmetsp:Transcript_20563/g.48448  ORF Transcript_20563/g.48448 Transcript_20563/m.48448 type:complete len:324 (-) Transcript_20563:332-1303(-)
MTMTTTTAATTTTTTKTTRFRTQYVRIWKCGNNQIRGLEEDLARHLETVDHDPNLKTLHLNDDDDPGLPPPCLYTAVRDPVQHFLSGYNEIEYRQLRNTQHFKLASAPYHTDVPYDENDPVLRRKRFRAFVEDLVLEDVAFAKNWQYSHCFSMSRVLAVLAMQGRALDGVIPDVANLTETWPGFLSETCPGTPPPEAFPDPERHGTHASSRDPLGTYEAAKQVWYEEGPIARTLCLLAATDYACFFGDNDGRMRIPRVCRSAYRDHARIIQEHGRANYLRYPKKKREEEDGDDASSAATTTTKEEGGGGRRRRKIDWGSRRFG